MYHGDDDNNANKEEVGDEERPEFKRGQVLLTFEICY